MAGYGEFWISRLDGEDLSAEEIEELEQVVSRDIWFDFGEDEVSISIDPYTYAGALAIAVNDRIEDTPDSQAPQAWAE